MTAYPPTIRINHATLPDHFTARAANAVPSHRGCAALRRIKSRSL